MSFKPKKIVPAPDTWDEVLAIIMAEPKLAFFSSLLFQQLKVFFVEDPEVDTAATDGTRIFVSPEFWGTLTNPNRVFLIAHEIMHYVLHHNMWWKRAFEGYTLGKDPIDQEEMNRAQDYIINDMLIRDKIGVMPSVGLHDTNIATHASDLMQTYLDLHDRNKQKGGGGNQDSGGNGGKGMDSHLPPPQPSNELDQSQHEVQEAVQAAKNAAEQMGTLPDSLRRTLGEILSPKRYWGDVLRDEFSAIAAGADRKTWRKPNKTMLSLFDIYMPSTTGFAFNRIAIVFDTSGSICDEVLGKFVGECKGMFNDLPSENGYELLYCNTRTYKHVHADNTDDIPEAPDFLQGGGTDMGDAVRYAKDKWDDLDAILILTDGYTPEPSEEDIPCQLVWATIASTNLSTGTVVEINEPA
jgi:predicted metal-dependent peptidase